MFSANMVRQYSFLNQLMTDLENDASKVCKQDIRKNQGRKKMLDYGFKGFLAFFGACLNNTWSSYYKTSHAIAGNL